MINAIKNYLLRKEIKNSSKIKKQFVEWERIQSAAILVGSEKYSIVKEFVKQSGKNFDLIVFNDDKTSKNNDCYLSLNKKDFNFFDLPKPEVAQKIKSKTYDILINADFKNDSVLGSITGLIPAKCKLGPETIKYSDFLDIRIQSQEPEFLKQAHKYLMMIKS